MGSRSRRPLLETSLDEDTLQRPQRSRSLGGLVLETNLDEDADAEDEEEDWEEERDRDRFGRGHSRSLGENGFSRLTTAASAPTAEELLESDLE